VKWNHAFQKRFLERCCGTVSNLSYCGVMVCECDSFLLSCSSVVDGMCILFSNCVLSLLIIEIEYLLNLAMSVMLDYSSSFCC
jgi:hypothetical protein